MDRKQREQLAEQLRRRGFRVTTRPDPNVLAEAVARDDAARPPVTRDPQQHDLDHPTPRERANVQLRRMGLAEIPEPASLTTKQDKARARLRRMGITPTDPTN